jgi:capsular exopolysaccharide synthesis family protein
VPREGKTFFAVALAKNAAAAGCNTLLIDCDLRRPSVAKQLGMSTRSGLEHIRLEGGCRVQTFTNGTLPFDVITAAPGTANPQDLLASPEVQAMLSRARSLYDLIILDAPPVLGFADARVLSTIADSTLLVVQWGRTSQKQVSAAIVALRLYGARIEGAVMNQVAAGNQTADENISRAVSRHYTALLK